MNNVIIVVGIDRTGKTPLCKMLHRAQESSRVIRLVDRPSDPITLLKAEQEIKRWWYINDGTLIYDRFPYPDEFVYGESLHRFEFPKWEDLIAATPANVWVVYCEPNNLTAFQKRAATDPDEFYDMTDLNVVVDHIGRYKLWLTQTRLPIIRMSCDKPFEMDDAERILSKVNGNGG